ncbi:MAG: glycosyltransferase [Chitinophagia bacterium]|jgi:hypothetical protein
MKKKILIINSDPFHNGPRMIKEIEALKSDYEIVALGRTKPHDPNIKYINIDRIYGFSRLIAKLYYIFFKKYYTGKLLFFELGLHQIINKLKPDLIINHNPIFFPAIFSFKKFAIKVVYNAHEYHPLQFEDEIWLKTAGKHYEELYRKFLPKVDLLINVCDSIAKKCEVEFGISSLVIPNAAPYHSTIAPNLVNSGQVIKIIHHGAAFSSRKIEKMIEAVGGMTNYELDLMLIPNDLNYYLMLKKLIRKYSNIRMIPTVPYNQIISFISSYDIGLFILSPSSFNSKFALPNKLFEFIQARLAIIVSPNDEMADLVRKFQIGEVTSGYEMKDLTIAFNQLTIEKINIYKKNSNLVACQLSAEVYYDKMKQAITNL